MTVVSPDILARVTEAVAATEKVEGHTLWEGNEERWVSRFVVELRARDIGLDARSDLQRSVVKCLEDEIRQIDKDRERLKKQVVELKAAIKSRHPSMLNPDGCGDYECGACYR